MRRPAWLLTFVVTMSFAASAFAQQPPAPQRQPLPPVLRRIVPGKALAGIAIGSRVNFVLARFGQPSEIQETAVDMVYTFNRFGIAVYVNGDRVSGISTSNSLLKIDNVQGTVDGTLGPGYRSEDVIRGFGRGFREGTVEGFPGPVYESLGVAFGIDRRAVAVVLVFRPSTASSVSGLLARAVAPPVAGFPHVANLRSHSQHTNYLSLPGYLRGLVFYASRTWITYAQAARVISRQQIASR